MVKAGEFREDLWFRINTFEIHLPPLRERREDISELILHLASRFCSEMTNYSLEQLLTPEALHILLHNDWPGNVRQLANTIEHALILADGFPIDVDSLPQTLNRKVVSENAAHPIRVAETKPLRPVISKPEDSSMALPVLTGPMADLMSFNPTLGQNGENRAASPATLRDLEMKAIESAMARHDGNKSKVAEELGISLKTLYNKLNPPEKRTA